MGAGGPGGPPAEGGRARGARTSCRYVTISSDPSAPAVAPLNVDSSHSHPFSWQNFTTSRWPFQAATAIVHFVQGQAGCCSRAQRRTSSRPASAAASARPVSPKYRSSGWRARRTGLGPGTHGTSSRPTGSRWPATTAGSRGTRPRPRGCTPWHSTGPRSRGPTAAGGREGGLVSPGSTPGRWRPPRAGGRQREQGWPPTPSATRRGPRRARPTLRSARRGPELAADMSADMAFPPTCRRADTARPTLPRTLT